MFVAFYFVLTFSVWMFACTVRHIRRLSRDARSRTWCLQCSTSTLNRIHFRRRKPIFHPHDSLALDLQYQTLVQVMHRLLYFMV